MRVYVGSAGAPSSGGALGPRLLGRGLAHSQRRRVPLSGAYRWRIAASLVGPPLSGGHSSVGWGLPPGPLPRPPAPWPWPLASARPRPSSAGPARPAGFPSASWWLRPPAPGAGPPCFAARLRAGPLVAASGVATSGRFCRAVSTRAQGLAAPAPAYMRPATVLSHFPASCASPRWRLSIFCTNSQFLGKATTGRVKTKKNFFSACGRKIA